MGRGTRTISAVEVSPDTCIQISKAHAFDVSVSLIILVCVSNWRFSTAGIKANALYFISVHSTILP